jgi:hypothetical protein
MGDTLERRIGSVSGVSCRDQRGISRDQRAARSATSRLPRAFHPAGVRRWLLGGGTVLGNRALTWPEPEPEVVTVTTKSDFTEDEWARVVRAPLVAGMAITLADPGGPIEATKETVATLNSATNPPSREQLLAEVALEIQAKRQQKQSPLGGYRPTADGPVGEQVLEELRAAQALVATKASPEEAAAFGRWLVAAAQAAAEAAKEGGFMGFGAQQVSDREQAMLDQVRAAVSG